MPGQAVSFQRDVYQILHIKGLRPEANGITDLVFARRIKLPISQEGVPRKWGSRGGDFERPLRVAFIGDTPLGASLVTFCASRK